MNENDKKSWGEDYAELVAKGHEVKPPENLFNTIKARLFPNPWKVFGKIAALHALVGFLSLSICNQFGLNPFQTHYSLSDFFMKAAGHNFCMFACGIFFVATTYLLANLILTLEELEAIRKYEWLQTGVIALVSIAGFYILGAELVAAFVGLWLLGAFLGGLVPIEASLRVRRQLG